MFQTISTRFFWIQARLFWLWWKTMDSKRACTT